MDRQGVKKLLPVLTAYAEGRVIQYKKNGVWKDITTDGDLYIIENAFINYDDYRIKPEPKYRPYYNVKECFKDMKKHEPFGYIRDKERKTITFILGTEDDEHEYLRLPVVGLCRLKTLFEDFVYYDGSPFGIGKEK